MTQESAYIDVNPLIVNAQEKMLLAKRAPGQIEEGIEQTEGSVHSDCGQERRVVEGAAAGESQARRQIANLRDQEQRLVEQASVYQPRRQRGGSVQFDYDPAGRRTLVVREGRLVAGRKVISEGLFIAIDRGTRLHLTGRNGAGKSTLLRSLVDRWDLPPERLLYLPQEMTAGESADLLDQVRSLPGPELGKVMQIVARLGADPARLLQSQLPSPGEIRQLALARGLGASAWLLVLDEPTNHLDLPAIERLEAALRAYPGALVVVTHDQRMAESIADRRYRLTDGVLATEPMA